MTALSSGVNEPVLARPRLVRWCAERPRIADGLVILMCAAPTIAALLLAPPQHVWLGAFCVGGTSVALWWRRTHPLMVLLIVVALATLNPVSGSSRTVALFESCFVLYALANYAPRSTAIVGYFLGEGMILAIGWIELMLGLRTDLPIVFFQPLSLLALVLGFAARANRSRRAAIDELVAVREDRAVAAERARITAEMHDVVAHSVTVMVALAGGAVAGWEKHPQRARLALEQLGNVGAHALEEMQRILRVLREHDPDLKRSLEASGHNVPALDELVELFRTAGLPVSLSVQTAPSSDRPPSADPALQTTIHRIVQEALTNALRHAHGATLVEVAVGYEAARITVSVTDNGAGSPAGPSVGAGVGLLAMRERALAFGGEFSAGPLPADSGLPARGWRIRVSVPAKEPAQ